MLLTLIPSVTLLVFAVHAHLTRPRVLFEVALPEETWHKFGSFWREVGNKL